MDAWEQAANQIGGGGAAVADRPQDPWAQAVDATRSSPDVDPWHHAMAAVATSPDDWLKVRLQQGVAGNDLAGVMAQYKQMGGNTNGDDAIAGKHATELATEAAANAPHISNADDFNPFTNDYRSSSQKDAAATEHSSIVGALRANWEAGTDAAANAITDIANLPAGGHLSTIDPNAQQAVDPGIAEHDTTIGRTIGGAAPIAAASLVNPLAGVIVGSAQGSGSALEEGRESGWTAGQTTKIAAERGMFNAILGLIPGGKGAGATAGEFFKKAAETYGLNVTQSVIENHLKNDLGIKSDSDWEALKKAAASGDNIAQSLLFASVHHVASTLAPTERAPYQIPTGKEIIDGQPTPTPTPPTTGAAVSPTAQAAGAPQVPGGDNANRLPSTGETPASGVRGERVQGVPPASVATPSSPLPLTPADRVAIKTELAGREYPEGSPVHGTDISALPAIAQEGLQPGKSYQQGGSSDEGVVYGSKVKDGDPGLAASYAAAKAPNLPAVLVLKPHTEGSEVGPGNITLHSKNGLGGRASYVRPADVEKVVIPGQPDMTLAQASEFAKKYMAGQTLSAEPGRYDLTPTPSAPEAISGVGAPKSTSEASQPPKGAPRGESGVPAPIYSESGGQISGEAVRPTAFADDDATRAYGNAVAKKLGMEFKGVQDNEGLAPNTLTFQAGKGQFSVGEGQTPEEALAAFNQRFLKEKRNALQQRSPAAEVSRTARAGENRSEGGGGVRQSERGDEVAGEARPQKAAGQKALSGGRSPSDLLLTQGVGDGLFPGADERGAIHPDAAEGFSKSQSQVARGSVSEDAHSNATAGMNAEQIADYDRAQAARFTQNKAARLQEAIEHYKQHPDPNLRRLAVYAEAEGTGAKVSVPVDQFHEGDTFSVGGKKFVVRIDPEDNSVHFVDHDVDIPHADTALPDGRMKVDAGSWNKSARRNPSEDFAPPEKTTGRQGSLLGERFEGSGIGSKSGSMFGDVSRGAASELEAKGNEVGQAKKDAETSALFGPGAASANDPNFRAITGGHVLTPEDAPRVARTVTSEPADAARKATLLSRISAGATDAYAKASASVKSAVRSVADEFHRSAQISFPALKRVGAKLADAAAGLASVPETKKYQLQDWTGHLNQIAKSNGMKPAEFMRLIGAANVEDQLQGIRDKFTAAGDAEKAGAVKTIIGAPNSPFDTRADYEKALNNPAMQEGMAYYRQFIEPTLTDNYKSSAKWKAVGEDGEPVEPPLRGKDLGAHVSLMAVHDGEEAQPAYTSGGLSKGGNVKNTIEKHSSLEREATGAANAYELDFGKLIENAVEKSTLPGAHARLYQSLVDSGVAVYGKPGDRPTIDNKPTVGLLTTPYSKAGESRLYVRSDVADEVRSALNIDKPRTPLRLLGSLMTRVQLASGVEAMSHIANTIPHLLTKPTAGGILPELAGRVNPKLGDVVRAAENLPVLKIAGLLDAVATKTFKSAFGDLATVKQTAELAKIGALQPEHAGNKLNPLSYASKGVQAITRAARLTLDDGYQLMVDKLGIPDTTANRRDYINQLGNYHKEAQSTLVQFSKESGMGPFATAGSAGVATSGRMLAGLSPGLNAGGWRNQILLRANSASQIAGVLAATALANYLRTGYLQPKGTPIGSLFLSTDKDGKAHYFDMAGIIGLRRAAKTVGADAVAEGVRAGDSPTYIADRALRQAENANISPYAGAIPTFGIEAATGTNIHGLYDAAGRVPRDQSQQLANLKSAVRDLNPSVERATTDGNGGMLSQLGRFAPQTGPSPDQQAAADRARAKDKVLGGGAAESAGGKSASQIGVGAAYAKMQTAADALRSIANNGGTKEQFADVVENQLKPALFGTMKMGESFKQKNAALYYAIRRSGLTDATLAKYGY